MPNPKQHKIYFDFGTLTLDSLYEPYQLKMDTKCIENGYINFKEYVAYKFIGAAHNEAAWRSRVAIPLKFLLN